MEGAPREHARPSRWELREEGEKGRGRERKWGGREGGALGQVLYWRSGWSTQVKGITGFIDVSDVTRTKWVICGRGQPALSHCCSRSTGWGTHSLFAGTLRQQETREL